MAVSSLVEGCLSFFLGAVAILTLENSCGESYILEKYQVVRYQVLLGFQWSPQARRIQPKQNLGTKLEWVAKNIVKTT
jgi:hypothetical protein